MVNSTTTVCTGSDGRMSTDGGIDREKIGIIHRQQLRKQRKDRPSHDERGSTGKAGCGKSARPV